jgi:hypothetical protein
MGMQTIPNYSDRAISLLPEFMKRNKAGDVSYFAQEIMAFADQIQALETAIMAVYLYRGIDAAVSGGYSQTLDDIGGIVGCPAHIVAGSLTMTNAEYAIALRAQIQMNASRGEPERLIAAIQFLSTSPGGTSCKVDYIQMQPASAVLNLENPSWPDFLGKDLSGSLALIPFWQQVMDKVKAGGVALSVQQSSSRPFCFSIDGATPWYSNGKGFGNNSTDVNGGQLATPLFTE